MILSFFTYLLALFSYNTIPLESGKINGVLVSVDDISDNSFPIWNQILSTADELNITSYVYFTNHTIDKNITKYFDKYYNNVVLIDDYFTNTIWMRDYGPIFYKNNYGIINILKIHYKHHRKYDNLMPYDFAYRFNIPINAIELIMEGGNLISNGNGICIISDKVYEYNSVKVIKLLKKYGCWKKIIIVKSLAKDGTRHVDMWLSWIDEYTLFAGMYTKEQDQENYIIMTSNIIYLKNQIPNLNVVYVPMPNRGIDDITRTYVNALIMNDHVILPTYDDKAYEKQAIFIWKQYFKHVHPVNVESLIKYDGAIHCIARTFPI